MNIQNKIFDAIEFLAKHDNKLLRMITSLPEINCNSFSVEEWIKEIKKEIKTVQVDDESSHHTMAINFLHEESRKRYSYLFYVHHLAEQWRIRSGEYSCDMNTKSMSKLIHTCKNKNIEELLNFL